MIQEKAKLQELSELDKKHFFHPTSAVKSQQESGPAFIFTEGKGVYLYDESGRKVIDGMSSLWNVNVGHGRRELGEAALEQMSKLAFSSSFASFSNEPAIRLAAKIAELAPGDLNAVFFTSGGSEANDTAYKLARHYWVLKGQPDRQKIISRTKAYHGVNIGATSATGLKPFRDFTNSLAPDFHYADHMSTEELCRVIEEEGPETVAAFVAEPVQGAGGVHIAADGYFKEVRRICDEYGILFITDEVITGFGRTGTFFGIEHDEVIPDMMCFAKGVTSGYAPLGGVVFSESLYKELGDLSTGTLLHGYTYSGHPMACAVALKNIEIIEQEGLVANAKRMGAELLKGFEAIKAEHSIVRSVRARGLMGAVELATPAGSEPLAPTVVAEAAKHGLICRSVTFDGQDTLVFAPPLIINETEIKELIVSLNMALQEVEKLMGSEG